MLYSQMIISDCRYFIYQFFSIHVEVHFVYLSSDPLSVILTVMYEDSIQRAYYILGRIDKDRRH